MKDTKGAGATDLNIFQAAEAPERTERRGRQQNILQKVTKETKGMKETNAGYYTGANRGNGEHREGEARGQKSEVGGACS